MIKHAAGPTRILLVDDDPVVLNSLGSGLRAHGYEVDTCSNGEQALKVNHSHPPDLMVMDF